MDVRGQKLGVQIELVIEGGELRSRNTRPISAEQRQEYSRLVEATISQIEAGQFLPHSGIRFPQNGCVSCAQLGLCLGNQQLVDVKLIRRPGASDLDWLDHLDD